MITPLVGGFEAAGDMPAAQALRIAQDYLGERKLEALRHAEVCWSSSLGIYSNGSSPPDPPDPEDYLD